MFIFQRKTPNSAQFVSASFRVGMVIILLLTACGPANPTGQPADVSPGGEQAGPSNPPLPTAEHFDAPTIVVPNRNSPEPDAPAAQLPPKPETEPVRFTVTASPAMVEVNGEVTLSVVIRNQSGAGLSGLAYSDRLESGLSLVSSPNGVRFDSGTISYAVGSIPDDREVEFSYILKVNALNAAYRDGELWLHTAGLKDGPGKLDLTAQAVFGVGTALASEETSVTAIQEEGGWYSVGEAAVYVPPEAIAQDGLLVLS